MDKLLRTPYYRIESRLPFIFNITLFLLFVMISLLLNIWYVGVLVGVIVNIGIISYQKSNNPGIIKHYFSHLTTPDLLSANNYEDEDDNTYE